MAAKKLVAQSLRLSLGLFMIILGILLFARDVGAISADFPVWPVVLVAFGVVFLAGEISKR